MEVRNIPISELKPYLRNAKKHTREQIANIAESLRRFGWVQPCVVDENGEIIIGHGRIKAAQKLNMLSVPCVTVSDLSPEEIRVLRIADNKLNESEWDLDNLFDDAEGLDFSGFTFDLGLDDEDGDIEEPDYKSETQDLKENILNLGYAQFPGVGRYDIPIIVPVPEIPPVTEWIGFNYVLSDKHPEGKGVHFFIDDYQFERVWNNPDAYLDKLSHYECVLAPDFSPYGDMPMAAQIFNHYRKHWCAAYWQANGITVIPTIRSSTDERSLEWYLDGEPEGGVVAYSSMWISDSNEFVAESSQKEWDMMIKTLNPSKVLVYGKVFPFMDGVETVRIEKFSEKRWGK